MQNELYDVKPIEAPPGILLPPWDYQLKAAAQIDRNCEGRFGGLILADPMGLGKTLTGTLAMWMRRRHPGMSLVIAPSAMTKIWYDVIRGLWKDVSGYLICPPPVKSKSTWSIRFPNIS